MITSVLFIIHEANLSCVLSGGINCQWDFVFSKCNMVSKIESILTSFWVDLVISPTIRKIY